MNQVKDRLMEDENKKEVKKTNNKKRNKKY